MFDTYPFLGLLAQQHKDIKPGEAKDTKSTPGFLRRDPLLQEAWSLNRDHMFQNRLNGHAQPPNRVPSKHTRVLLLSAAVFQGDAPSRSPHISPVRVFVKTIKRTGRDFLSASLSHPRKNFAHQRRGRPDSSGRAAPPRTEPPLDPRTASPAEAAGGGAAVPQRPGAAEAELQPPGAGEARGAAQDPAPAPAEAALLLFFLAALLVFFSFSPLLIFFGVVVG